MTESLQENSGRSLAAAEVLTVLKSRRSISTFLPDPVPTALLEEALDAGRFAVNHKLTEPWRFTVIGPALKVELAALWSEAGVRKLPADSSPERREEVRKAAAGKWLSKPTVVVVTQLLDPDPERRQEDYAAVACAMQNIQLAAWALGLGCQWSTSPATRDPAILERAGVPATEGVVGFLFVGYPAAIPETRRRPLAEVLRYTE